jgi:hypothetical protein
LGSREVFALCWLGTQGPFGLTIEAPSKRHYYRLPAGHVIPIAPKDASSCGAGTPPAGRPSNKAARAPVFEVAAMALRDPAAANCPPLSVIPASVENRPPQ